MADHAPPWAEAPSEPAFLLIRWEGPPHPRAEEKTQDFNSPPVSGIKRGPGEIIFSS